MLLALGLWLKQNRKKKWSFDEYHFHLKWPTGGPPNARDLGASLETGPKELLTFNMRQSYVSTERARKTGKEQQKKTRDKELDPLLAFKASSSSSRVLYPGDFGVKQAFSQGGLTEDFLRCFILFEKNLGLKKTTGNRRLQQIQESQYAMKDQPSALEVPSERFEGSDAIGPSLFLGSKKRDGISKKTIDVLSGALQNIYKTKHPQMFGALAFWAML